MGDTEKFGNNVPTTPSNSPEEEWDDIDDSLFFYEEFEPVEFSREEEEEDSNEPDYENGEFLTEEEKNSFSARKHPTLLRTQKTGSLTKTRNRCSHIFRKLTVKEQK